MEESIESQKRAPSAYKSQQSGQSKASKACMQRQIESQEPGKPTRIASRAHKQEPVERQELGRLSGKASGP